MVAWRTSRARGHLLRVRRRGLKALVRVMLLLLLLSVRCSRVGSRIRTRVRWVVVSVRVGRRVDVGLGVAKSSRFGVVGSLGRSVLLGVRVRHRAMLRRRGRVELSLRSLSRTIRRRRRLNSLLLDLHLVVVGLLLSSARAIAPSRRSRRDQPRRSGGESSVKECRIVEVVRDGEAGRSSSNCRVSIRRQRRLELWSSRLHPRVERMRSASYLGRGCSGRSVDDKSSSVRRRFGNG